MSMHNDRRSEWMSDLTREEASDYLADAEANLARAEGMPGGGPNGGYTRADVRAAQAYVDDLRWITRYGRR